MTAMRCLLLVIVSSFAVGAHAAKKSTLAEVIQWRLSLDANGRSKA